MKTFIRIISDTLKQDPKELYWQVSRDTGSMIRLLRSKKKGLARHVVKDQIRFLTSTVRPVEGESLERARAAVEWLLRAQDATPSGGVSLGYFPGDPGQGNGWRAAYPETTGYIISSLLEFSQRFEDEKVRQRALKLAVWETQVQMASGAIQGGPVCPPEKQTAAVFNTGMVLQGYTSAYRASGDIQFLNAGRRAADFLVGDLGRDGYFRTHGRFVAEDQIKTYECLCAWALWRFGEDAKDERYHRAAVQVIEAALKQQQGNGWIANNCLSNPEAPLLHTIGYTLQGILEVGILAARRDFVEAARRGADPLLDRVSRDGFLHGRYYSNWEPAVFSSCLTGNAQLAVVYYRLYEMMGHPPYRTVADRLVNYLKSLQAIDSDDPSVNGAIPGSFPLMGSYMTGGYPNWATKYFLDALLFQHRLQQA